MCRRLAEGSSSGIVLPQRIPVGRLRCSQMLPRPREREREREGERGRERETERERERERESKLIYPPEPPVEARQLRDLWAGFGRHAQGAGAQRGKNGGRSESGSFGICGVDSEKSPMADCSHWVASSSPSATSLAMFAEKIEFFAWM